MKSTQKIAIIGGAPSYEGAPFDDPDWQIWAIAVGYSRLPPEKVDRWFEIHSREVIENRDKTLYRGFDEWLFNKDTKRAPVTIFPDSQMDDVPNSLMFPRQRIEERFGHDWWTSTVAWMFAQALANYDSDIALFGIEMNDDEEYGVQQAALRHFRDIALLSGRKIIVPKGWNLLHPVKMYPDCEQSRGYQHCEREITRMKQDQATIDRQVTALQGRSDFCRGALDVYDHLMRNGWV